ncbi:MAG: Imm58 family immunity protein [Mobilitalea sp.]
MNKWKIAFFCCLVLFIASSAFFIYSVIDQGVSYTYLKVSYDEQVEANKVLGNLIVKGGQKYSQKDILYLLRQEYPKAFIVEEKNTISIGANKFEFEKDRLVKVK